MLTLYKSRTIREGAEKVLSEIKKHKGRNVVIVPDPFTLAVEQFVTQKLGAKAVFDVEVMSFARLAAVTLKKKIKKCLSPAGSVMLMEKVIRANEEALKRYRGAARKAGFASEVYAAITSLRNSGVTAEQLADAEKKLSGGVADKTHDLALLYSAYLEELTVNHSDSTTRLEALVEAILAGGEYGDVHFHVVDYVDLNRKQIEVVSALVKKARSVTVAVAVGEGAENENIYPRLYDKLKQEIAPFSEIKEIDVPFSLTGDRAKMADSLFSYSFTPGASSDLTLAEAKDMTEEVTYLATEIVRLVKCKKMRYSDVAVITPSFPEYLPYVERIFPRYGIPFFPDARYPLAQCEFFRYALRAMQLLEKRYEQTVVRAFVIHPLFDAVTPEEKAAFCDYLDMTGVNYDRFRAPFAFYLDAPSFAPAEKVRCALEEELLPLADLPTSGSIQLYADALRSFLEKNDYEKRLENYVKKEIESRDLKKQAEILRRTYPALIDLLDVLVELRGKETVTLSEFLLALVAGAEQVKLAALPVRLDCVYFAAVEQAMYSPISNLFVLGAEDALFPLEKIKDGILGATEYAAWQNNGVEFKVENTEVEQLAASKFHALQLLLRADALTLTHLDGLTPSPCIGQLKQIFGIKKLSKCADLMNKFPLEVLIPTRDVAKSTVVESSRREKESLLSPQEEKRAATAAAALGAKFPLPYKKELFDSIPSKIAKKLFFRQGTVSVSEIECYFDCPFRFFVQYGLAAKERVFADHDARDVGNLAHDCMEVFVKEHLAQLPKGETMEEDVAKAIVRAIALDKIKNSPRYQAITEKEGSRILQKEVDNITQLCLTVKEQIDRSEFKPTFFELGFGYAKSKKPLVPYRILGLTLKGRMDRVDLYRAPNEEKPYAVAIDYKTGDHQIGIDKIYMGLKVQLPLYAAVLSASGYEPVATLYASLKSTNKEAYLFGPKRFREDLMNALDSGISTAKSPYTGLKKTKGEITGKLLMSEQEFKAIGEYAVAVTEGAIKEIFSGCVIPSPHKSGEDNSCSYCNYKGICRRSGEVTRSIPSGIKGENFFSSIHKEKKRGN